jgi:hypothetical protein
MTEGIPPRKVKLHFVDEETYLQDFGLTYDDFPLTEKNKFNDAKLLHAESLEDRTLYFLSKVKGSESK